MDSQHDAELTEPPPIASPDRIPRARVDCSTFSPDEAAEPGPAN